MKTPSGSTTTAARRRAIKVAPRSSMSAKASVSISRSAVPRGPGLLMLSAIRTNATARAPLGVIE